MKTVKAQTQEATHTTQTAPTAAELMSLVERGETDKAEDRIKSLSQRDYVAVLKVVRQIDIALSDYALSWKNGEYWGQGVDYPAEAQAKAA